eukprot:8658095-Pyramimonas_sp.AAC.1
MARSATTVQKVPWPWPHAGTACTAVAFGGEHGGRCAYHHRSASDWRHRAQSGLECSNCAGRRAEARQQLH